MTLMTVAFVGFLIVFCAFFKRKKSIFVYKLLPVMTWVTVIQTTRSQVSDEHPTRRFSAASSSEFPLQSLIALCHQQKPWICPSLQMNLPHMSDLISRSKDIAPSTCCAQWWNKERDEFCAVSVWACDAPCNLRTTKTSPTNTNY